MRISEDKDQASVILKDPHTIQYAAKLENHWAYGFVGQGGLSEELTFEPRWEWGGGRREKT